MRETEKGERQRKGRDRERGETEKGEREKKERDREREKQ